MAFNTDKLSYLHSFSKMPVQSGSNFNDGTTLGNAINKSGHTVTASEVWASDIPYFGKMGSLDDVKSKVQPYASKNDMCFITTTKKTYIYDGDDTWTEITLKDGDIIKNAKDEAVLLYHKGINLTNLTATNNANTDSANNAARLWVTRDKEGKALPQGETRLVEQFVGPTDKAINGLASVAYSPVLADGSLVAGTNYYDYCFSGTILWASARTAATKIDCFEYIGPKVSTVVDTVSSQGTTLQNVKDQVDTISEALGLGATPNQDTLGSRVTANETALKVLLGIAEGDKVAATESIAATAANAVSTSLAGSTAGTIGKAIADAKQEALDAINAIQHFSVVVVPVGQTMENVTPVENTIYLVSDSQAADGSYIEYIAFKQGEAVVTEKIGSTKLDLTGYTTDAEHEALQGRVSTIETTTVPTLQQAITDGVAGAKSEAATNLATARTEITAEIAQAKSEAIASAEVTINQGTGIVVTGAGKGTTFTIAVSDDVATAASVSALSQVVASNKTEIEGKITAAETALETAKTEIKGTTDALDTRLQTAEGKVSTLEGQVATLTTGDNSVAKQIETAATAIKGQSLAQTGTLSGMFSVTTAGSVGTGITGITISDTGLSTAIAAAKSGAEQTAATALSTARGEITTEISTAVSGLETKLTTGDGSLGAKVAALETATGTTLPAAIEQALTDAKAYSDSLHTTSLDYVVLGDSESLPTASADTLGKIYLVASQNAPTADGSAISGSYVEYMTRKVSETEYTWEKIGTTAADLSAYAKTSEVNAAVASVQGEVDALETTHATDKAALEASIATKVGDVQWFDENDLLSTKAEVKDGKLVVSEQEITWERTVNSPWNATVTKLVNNEAFAGDTKIATVETSKIKDGTYMFYNVELSEYSSNLDSLTSAHYMFYETSLETFCNDMSSLTSGYQMFSSCSKLTTFIGDLSSLTNGTDMFSSCSKLTTFIGDLSSLTNGQCMFQYCSELTTFESDLSSLTNGVLMFYGTTLSEFDSDLSSLTDGTDMFNETQLSLESIACIAETIATNENSARITIKWKPVLNESVRQEYVDVLSRIVDKGWTLETNQELLPLFDSEKYQTGETIIQPLDLESEPQTVYYVVKK